MVTIVNLTPHTLNVVDDTGKIILSVAPSGTVARVVTQQTVAFQLGGIDVVWSEAISSSLKGKTVFRKKESF